MKKRVTVWDEDDFVAAWSPTDGYYFAGKFEGKFEDVNKDIPEPAMALVAALLRLDVDEDFYQSCLNWFKVNKKRAS